MRVALAKDIPESLVDTSVGARRTSELLGIVLGSAGVGRVGLDEIARAIDSGRMAIAAAIPDDLSTDAELQFAAVPALVAAFELARRAALGRATVVIRGPADVAAIAQRELGGLGREHVLVIACDAANRPLRTVVVAQGAVDHAPIPVREILNAVLRCDGRVFALAHNHPSGDPEPSDSDVVATARVADAARVVGLRFLGHVVVAEDRWSSVATTAQRTPG